MLSTTPKYSEKKWCLYGRGTFFNVQFSPLVLSELWISDLFNQGEFKGVLLPNHIHCYMRDFRYRELLSNNSERYLHIHNGHNVPQDQGSRRTLHFNA